MKHLGAGSPTTVIFDLGGVVLDSPVRFIGQFERENNLPAGWVARLVGGYGEGSVSPWHALERGELSIQEFYDEFSRVAIEGGHPFDVRALMQGMSAHCAIRPFMVDAIRRLRAKRLKVVALTNIWAAPAGFDERLNALQGEFDAFIESYRVGLRKPEVEIYHLACDAVGIEPSQAVFLDDIGTNLKVARRMGMTTIKVDAPEDALRELGSLLSLDLGPAANETDHQANDRHDL